MNLGETRLPWVSVSCEPVAELQHAVCPVTSIARCSEGSWPGPFFGVAYTDYLMLLNCGVGEERLLRVPWTARRSNQSILKRMSPGYSLEELMLKLKLQYFGHLMRRPDAGTD